MARTTRSKLSKDMLAYVEYFDVGRPYWKDIDCHR